VRLALGNPKGHSGIDGMNISIAAKAIDELVEAGDNRAELEFERQERFRRFPQAVILAGVYPEHDFAKRWCWQTIGPCDGECHDSSAEYPGCPLVLATERAEPFRGWPQKKYSTVAEHVHEGLWTWFWLGKTDYNYGFGEFYFANGSDIDRFVTAVPTFSWGENYDPAWGRESPVD
jgi:hypothetical protein